MFLNEATEVVDLEALLSLTDASTPPRKAGGIYFVRDIGGASQQSVWAQYRVSSTVDVDENVLYPVDNLGVDIIDEGRWHLFKTGISAGDHASISPADSHGPKVLSFTGDPASFVPTATGLIYVATDTNFIYRSTGTTAGDLVQIGGAESTAPDGTIPMFPEDPAFYGLVPTDEPDRASIHMQYKPEEYSNPEVYRLWIGIDSTQTVGISGWIYLDGFVTA
jgi:hypothetical protein